MNVKKWQFQEEFSVVVYTALMDPFAITECQSKVALEEVGLPHVCIMTAQ
jgi:hypothetical protein